MQNELECLRLCAHRNHQLVALTQDTTVGLGREATGLG